MAMRYRIVVSVALPVFLAVISGCGRGDDDPTRATKPAAQSPADAAAAASQASAARDERRAANAVATGAAGAAVDLQYEVTPRPEKGQPFTIQLAFVPQTPADSIEAQLSATPGLRITSAESVRFADVKAGERYTTDVLVVGDTPGLYYVGVVARMATQVQTDARTFSVPVVVGAPLQSTETQPAPDASGSAIVTPPAQETSGS
jgi:hypothetical protein